MLCVPVTRLSKYTRAWRQRVGRCSGRCADGIHSDRVLISGVGKHSQEDHTIFGRAPNLQPVCRLRQMSIKPSSARNASTDR